MHSCLRGWACAQSGLIASGIAHDLVRRLLGLRAHPRQELVGIAPGRALVASTATRDGNRTLIRPVFMDPKNDNRNPHGLRPAQAKLLAIVLCGLVALYTVAAIVGGSIGALLRDNPQPLVVEKVKNSA